MNPVVHIEVSLKQDGRIDSIEASPLGNLYPILPQHAGRYLVAKRVERSHTVIEPGMFMSSRTPVPQYLPPQWSRHVHPEGQVYFCRMAQFTAVTDAHLSKDEVANKITKWISHIEKQALHKSFNLSSSVELYLQLEDDDCNYYFVDHSTRTLFWLDAFETHEVGLLPVVSSSHLKLQLEEQYWQHLEYFCMHPLDLESNIIEEAISHLVHGCGDHMTSQSSTFPYSVKECKQFLTLLVPARDRVHDGQVLSLAARLNNAIAANRFWTHYGQEQARLSRDVEILAKSGHECTWTQSIASFITFGTSETFRSRLTSIFNDSYVYEYDWRSTMTDNVKTWRTAFGMSLGFLTLHLFCFYLPVLQPLALVSGACLSLSLLSATMLLHCYEPQTKGTAGDAYSYLSKTRSPKFGFQGPALLFALPQAFNLWGIFLLFSQAFCALEPFYLACIAAILAFSTLAVKMSSVSIPRIPFIAPQPQEKSNDSTV
ncbi:hypothetical protein FA15DRAFT_667833 [Coprinopsis marcescibilis]|uniref:WW domain-containing protein n=1 Tax=Coprinopsis marcescibilis TaxID=230819 RepID=A0A5C3L0B7_COPMA|nr:hypothetical protein FA15DRAFT_667833 [Coprinopsis marcescibilis]